MGRLHIDVVEDVFRGGEKAWRIGGTDGRAGLNVPDFSFNVNAASGRDAIDPATRAADWDDDEHVTAD